MDMNKLFFKRVEDREPQWRIIDATDKVVGRLATDIADALRGKDKPEYTPNIDCGDYIVVINTDKLKFTGDKLEKKTYDWYTGYIGGLKTLTAKEMMKKDSTRVLELAVERMLPKTKMGRAVIKKLKLYSKAEHPHMAQLNTVKAA